jgi:hypothetical protein
MSDRLTAKALPNPFSDYFTLITTSESDIPITVLIVDAAGRVLEKRRNVSTNSSLRIGARYRSGTYFVEVMQGKEKVVLKLIKQSN